MSDFIKLLIFVLILTNITDPLLTDNKNTNYVNKTEIYIVQKDDNLWKIAEKYKQNNKEEFILAIKELNKLENSRLYINQKLIVP